MAEFFKIHLLFKNRHEIEDIIFKQKEEIYAREQASQWEEIATYIDLIASRRDRR